MAEALRNQWQAEAAKLGPAIAELGRAATPEVKKMLAYWDFAQSKALAPAPDYGAAVKTAANLAKMIMDHRAKKEKEAKDHAAMVAAREPPRADFVNGAPRTWPRPT